jgi:flagellar basal-body rod protein FlgG
MPKGIYAAASAMVVETRTQEVVARNIANLQTDGYRKETALRTSFATELAKRGAHGDLSKEGGAGVLPAGSFFSFGDGTQEATGAPLDLALHGDGFYRVRDDQGKVHLTRAAHFNTDAQGRLVTPDGWTVEGQGGPIVVPSDANRVTVDKSGRISVQSTVNGVATDTVLDQLRIVQVDQPTRMTARNGQYFDPGDQAQRDATGVEVRQGYLEHANVDPIQELVQMISGQRRYDAAQRALKEQASLGGGLSDMLRGNI